MNSKISTLPNVSIHNDKAITTSLDVAEYFCKLHKDVLRKIESLDCSNEFTERNFTLCFKNNELQNGKPQPYYEMTKNGFIFLVMGFTGKKAAQFKEAYIAEFDRMEAQLHNAVTVTGNTSKILLTLLPNGKVDSARVIHDNEYVASLESLFEIGRRAGYMIIHKDELIKKLSE
ncbi:Rha family transcriptional regulator [Arsenophonus apicola]|uniref:Rha family transcriptional regulator n=1 Tax=Arsenophonus apicola TaxID=2879119 RepID=A0ABY8P1U9_9GAMM|nr:Rha family transcriptional regulator [Arsenophonus apicola]WGO83174.1 Rha family transcriptional regulator [Arsenophonus apicola]